MACPHCHPYQATHVQDKLGFFPEFFLRPIVWLIPHRWGDTVWSGVLRLFELLRLGSWKTVSSGDYEGKHYYLWQGAEQFGWEVQRFFFLGQSTATHRIVKGKFRLLVDDLLPCIKGGKPFHGAINDKATMRRVLSKATIPIPAGSVFWRKKTAQKCAEELGAFVLKSRDGSLSKHVQVQPENFNEAWDIVKQVSFSPLVEAFVEGAVFRATTVHGQLVAVCRRNPAEVNGKIVMAAGARMVDVTDELHPKNRALFEYTASVVGGAILGIDFIAGDPAQPWDQQSFAVIELNSFPNFDMHHAPHEGAPRDIAGAYWKKILQRFDA